MAVIPTPTPITPTPTPAQQLQGMDLGNGWHVATPVARPEHATGSNFSQGYLVENDHGHRAFLKALDLIRPFSMPDPVKVINAITEVYEHERELFRRCETSKLDRIVRVLCDGKILADTNDPRSLVPYLIFELADRGDVRTGLAALTAFDRSWSLSVLHQVATGLKQLHGIGVSHQDLKPSNVLLFSDIGAKVGDLGRSVCRNVKAPHDGAPFCGDLNYAPPEIMYGDVNPDWSLLRLGCDLYMLGSLIVFIFDGVSMTSSLIAQLRKEHSPHQWGGTFRQVLPYVQSAFSELLQSFGLNLPINLRGELVQLVKELCEPDPLLRGNSANRSRNQNQFSLEQCVTKLDLLQYKICAGRPGY